MFQISIFLTLLSVFQVHSVFIYQLGGQWTATGEYDSKTISVNASVPGGIYSDLMSANEIGDILNGYNDAEYVWVSLTNWTYTKEFEVPDELLSHENINIVFEGVDTFASITINGKEVGQTGNMFVKYVFPIKDLLRTDNGTNTLRLDFTSAVTEAENLARIQSEDYEIPPNCNPDDYHGACHVNQIRKMQASFAWDWGPSVPSTGIWKNVYLQGYTNAVITYAIAKPLKKEDNWVIPLKVYFSDNSLGSVGGVLNWELIDLNGVTLLNDSAEINVTANEFGEFLWNSTIEIPEDDVELWWPNDYGYPTLYNLVLTLTDDFENDNISSWKNLKIGFRTIELIQDDTMKGLNFYFQVNGIPIFAKGANEIPLSVLPEKGQDPESVRKLLTTVRDSHMNMIRVWGGGVYESNEFYKLADEFGILIWQDFMFACALYPTRPDYLNTVIEEVRHQVKRLHSHPSVAIWAGNNENEAALMQNWYDIGDNLDLFKKDYVKLYIDTIKAELFRITEESLFITSSPTNGKESDDEGYLANIPNSNLYGDVHFYEYSMDNWNPQTFPIPRFASEYGYQSMPSLDSWKTATENSDDLKPNSDFLKHRQHHPGGEEQNINLIKHQFDLPDTSDENYLETLIYYSQIVQAMAIKTETEHYRSFMGRFTESGEGNTMGALYWQLNDVWVAPTWSGLDFTGRWKMLQYFVADFFNPVLITPQVDYVNGKVEVFVVTDPVPNLPETDGVIMWHVFHFDNQVRPTQTVEPVTLVPGASVKALEIDLDETLESAGCGSNSTEAYNNCYIFFHMLNANWTKVIAPVNYVFLGKLKDSNIQPANLKVSTVEATQDPNIFNIAVESDAIAYFTWIDSHDIAGRFSINGWLHFDKIVNVKFFADSDSVTVEELQNALTVTHLAQTMGIVN